MERMDHSFVPCRPQQVPDVGSEDGAVAAAAHDGADEVGQCRRGVRPRMDLVPAPRLQGRRHGPGKSRSVCARLWTTPYFFQLFFIGKSQIYIA
ncbi:hypothetical protein CEXT_486901 [Caerostris extrusa]|uniref:Uncharacterized protein n=1 Tax=Caerostris extrusa TaxID=172846 RepID=A0AAV4UPJ1_CAEEX|nr:hypothetical protein CEXT_486901 [Caerostris extrusa]